MGTMGTTKAYLSVSDAAAETGLSKAFWRKAIRLKAISYFKMGRSVKISRSDLEHWVAAHRISAIGPRERPEDGEKLVRPRRTKRTGVRQ